MTRRGFGQWRGPCRGFVYDPMSRRCLRCGWWTTSHNLTRWERLRWRVTANPPPVRRPHA